MAKKCTYKLKFRRRREMKTDYAKRLALVKSKLPRLVIRKTNKYIIAQIVKFSPEGDITIAHINSSKLKKLGWKFSCKNLPAAYLTGLLCGIEAKKKNINNVILDIGRFSSTKKVFACLKGCLDAGINIPYNKEKIPQEERIKGKHIQEFLKNNIVEEFERVRLKIMG